MPPDDSFSEPQEHDILGHAPQGPELGTRDDDEACLLDILIVVVEQKRMILKVTAGFAIAAILVSLLLPSRYTATLTLMPPEQSSSMGAALVSQLRNLGAVAALAGGGLGLKNPNDMFVAMFKSHTVEDAMIQRFGLMQEYRKRYISDARKAFEAHATVDGRGKDGLIHISIEDRDPRRAAELANGYVEEFRILSQHLAITEASQRRLFFEGELEQAKDNLAKAEADLVQTERSTGVIHLDSQTRALIGSAASLRAQITAREVQIRGMQTYAAGENAKLVQAKRELEGMRAQLAKLGGSEENTGGDLIVPKGRVPEAGLDYVRKVRDVKYNETVFDILARQFEIAKLDEAKQGALIQVVDPASVPDKRSFPKRSLIVAGATLVGFIFALLLAFSRAGIRQLKREDETSQKLAALRRAFSFRARRA
jgi:uncharacterized protein involved in exopolysaccharide biosynthesis